MFAANSISPTAKHHHYTNIDVWQPRQKEKLQNSGPIQRLNAGKNSPDYKNPNYCGSHCDRHSIPQYLPFPHHPQLNIIASLCQGIGV